MNAHTRKLASGHPCRLTLSLPRRSVRSILSHEELTWRTIKKLRTQFLFAPITKLLDCMVTWKLINLLWILRSRVLLSNLWEPYLREPPMSAHRDASTVTVDDHSTTIALDKICISWILLGSSVVCIIFMRWFVMRFTLATCTGHPCQLRAGASIYSCLSQSPTWKRDWDSKEFWSTKTIHHSFNVLQFRSYSKRVILSGVGSSKTSLWLSAWRYNLILPCMIDHYAVLLIWANNLCNIAFRHVLCIHCVVSLACIFWIKKTVMLCTLKPFLLGNVYTIQPRTPTNAYQRNSTDAHKHLPSAQTQLHDSHQTTLDWH